MGIFDGIARAFGDLRPLSDEELAEQYEALRLRAASHKGLDNELQHLDNELHRYNAEIARRMNEAHARENPNPQRVHREHGWRLPNDE
jgi:ribosomal protein L29